jgi:hypothetical protein
MVTVQFIDAKNESVDVVCRPEEAARVIREGLRDGLRFVRSYLSER